MAEGESGQAFHDVGTQEGIEEDQEGITKNPIQKIKNENWRNHEQRLHE